jgi:hypothetical protein
LVGLATPAAAVPVGIPAEMVLVSISEGMALAMAETAGAEVAEAPSVTVTAAV